jgi:hypothetical protein
MQPGAEGSGRRARLLARRRDHALKKYEVRKLCGYEGKNYDNTLSNQRDSGIYGFFF